jgi:hypothetical protein
MNTDKIKTRIIILSLVIFALTCSAAYPQGTDSRKGTANKEKFYLGIVLSPRQTSIGNEEFPTNLTSKKGTSMNFGFEAGYFFSKFAGISFGAGFNPYSSQLSLGSYNVSYDTVDNDTPSESYKMIVDGNNIVEDQKVAFLSVPVSIHVKFPAGEKLGFFIKGGISFDIPVVKSYNSAGTFSYSGYYKDYPITLTDLPQYGFPSNQSTSVNGSLNIKSFCMSLAASGGATFYVNESIQLALGLHYYKSIGNISGYSPKSTFRLSSVKNDLRSFMAGSSSANLQAVGLSIGVKYFLR